MFLTEEMQANSYWQKMALATPPKKLSSSGVGSYILTFTVWRD